MTNNVKFLLVDDLEENLVALEALLAREGLELHLARSGEDALELMLANDYALALLDVQMPGLDGSAVLRAIRATPELAQLPVVVVTSTTERARVLELIELGVAGYLVKQSGVEETLRRLERVVATIRASAVEPDAESPEPTESATRARRVLVADPDASFRALVRLALEPAFVVAEARTGPEALRAFAAVPADVAVIGDRLDLLGGEHLAAGIRASGGEATRILLARDGPSSPAPGRPFDGAMTRSFVPANVLAALSAMAAG